MLTNPSPTNADEEPTAMERGNSITDWTRVDDEELDKILQELINHYEFTGTAHFTPNKHLDKQQAKAALQAYVEQAEWKAYDKGWEDCEKQEPVKLVDAITFRQEQYGWNDSKMAAMLDLSKSNYSEFKSGKRGLPINSIRKAYAIGVPASVLLHDDTKAVLQHLTQEEKGKK